MEKIRCEALGLVGPNAEATPLVSALVLNYRSPQVTVKCVEELQRQTIGPHMEIIVVDNHSRDDSIGVLRNRLRNLPRVRIVETPKNRGFGGGYNTGARLALGTYLLINNPPKILETNAVERLVQKMQKNPTIGILAPRLIHPDETVRESARAFPSPLDLLIKRTALQRLFSHRLHRYLQLHQNMDSAHDVDWVVGGCFMIERTLFQDLGGFDERFFLFFEDTDLCRRVRERGKTIVYDPTITGRDRKQRLSEGGLLSLLIRNTGRSHLSSALKYFWKWHRA